MPANRITTSSASRRRPGALVLFIHWRAEPSGAPHPARALGRAGDFFLHWRVCPMIGGAERIEVKSAVIGEHPQVIIAPP